MVVADVDDDPDVLAAVYGAPRFLVDGDLETVRRRHHLEQRARVAAAAAARHRRSGAAAIVAVATGVVAHRLRPGSSAFAALAVLPLPATTG